MWPIRPCSSRSVRERGLADLLEPVGHAKGGHVEVDQAAEVDRRPDQDELGAAGLDRRAQVVHLLAAVAHRREQRAYVGVVLEGLGDRADRGGSWVDQLGGAIGLRGQDGRAVGHLAVGQRRPILDREHALAGDLGDVALDGERRGGEHDPRGRVVRPDRVEHRIDAFLRRAVDLVHDADIGHPQVRLARVVAKLVPRPVRVDHDDVHVRLHERGVVVAAVPDDHVRLLLGPVEDRGVVDPGEDEVALGDMRLVLLALLDCRVCGVEILVALEALHGLLGQVAVGHRVAQNCDTLAGLAQERRDVPGRLALARAGADRADRDSRLLRGQHRLARRDQAERRAGRERPRADVHDVFVRDVGVGEDDLVDVVQADKVLQLVLGADRNSLGVERARELGRIHAALDVRDLRRCEADDLVLLAPAVHDVEVVEVPPGRAGNQHSRPRHA